MQEINNNNIGNVLGYLKSFQSSSSPLPTISTYPAWELSTATLRYWILKGVVDDNPNFLHKSLIIHLKINFRFLEEVLVEIRKLFNILKGLNGVYRVVAVEEDWERNRYWIIEIDSPEKGIKIKAITELLKSTQTLRISLVLTHVGERSSHNEKEKELNDLISYIKKYLFDIKNKLLSEGKELDGVFVSYYFYSDSGDMDHITSFIPKRKIFRLHYPEIFPIDVKELLKEFALSRDSILILHGPPGSGKSKLLRFLSYYNSAASVIRGRIDVMLKEVLKHIRAYIFSLKIIENEDWYNLFESNIIINIFLQKPKIEGLTDTLPLIILDDFDGMKSRDTSSNPFSIQTTNTLLSITDGVFNEEAKFVVTTNLEKMDIDPAFLRPGRLFDRIVIGKIPVKFITERLDLSIQRLEEEIEDLQKISAKEKGKEEIKEFLEEIEIVKELQNRLAKRQGENILLSEVGNLIDDIYFEKREETKKRKTYMLIETDGVESYQANNDRRVGF